MKPFTNIIKPPTNDGSLYSCPCCGERTLSERGSYEICDVCGWEDDGQDDHDADEVRRGPNGGFSLTQARREFSEQHTKKRDWKQ